jgi:23S rRNA pseudouridine1911/1915/1917 synthase
MEYSNTRMLKRLDMILVEKFHITRSKAERLIENNLVYVNGKLIIKKHGKFSIEAMIEIIEKDHPKPKIEYIMVEDEFLIVNKPMGLICHSSSTTAENTYSLNQLVAEDYSLSEALVKEEFGLPHRIDKDTEGLVILSRTNEFYKWALNAFEKGQIKKTYLCIVEIGKKLKNEDSLKLNLYYGRDKVLVKEDGVNSITNYKILGKHGKYAILEVEPLTGRRHQIRVALSSIGSPIVGDKLYGGKNFERMCLYSKLIYITENFMMSII